MEENNKYYIPDISEFHIGFEYEIFDLVWHKVTITNKMACQIITQPLIDRTLSFFSYIQEALTFDRIRVKWLDEQDCNELGLHSDKVRQWGGRMCFATIEGRKIRMTYDLTSKECSILNCDEREVPKSMADNWYFRSLFRGVIKNKSELKKVLQTLNLNNGN